MYRHCGTSGLEVVNDLPKAVGGCRGGENLVLGTKFDKPAIRSQRFGRHHAALVKVCTATQHEAAPVVVPSRTAAHAEGRNITLIDGLTYLQKVVKSLRRLHTRAGQQIGPVIEVEHDILKRHVVAFPIGCPMHLPEVGRNVLLTGPFGKIAVQWLQRLHLQKARLIPKLDHCAVRCRASD